MSKRTPSAIGILLVLGMFIAILFVSTKLSIWAGIQDGQFILLSSLLILICCFFAFGWINSFGGRKKKDKEELPLQTKSDSKNSLTTREKFDDVWNIVQGGFIVLCILIFCFFFIKSCISD